MRRQLTNYPALFVFSHTQVHAHPEHADGLEQVYAETTRLSAFEPGILHYSISRDPEDPALFHFYERYKDRAAFEEHNKTPVIRKLLYEQRYIKTVEAKILKPIAPAAAPRPAA